MEKPVSSLLSFHFPLSLLCLFFSVFVLFCLSIFFEYLNAHFSHYIFETPVSFFLFFQLPFCLLSFLFFFIFIFQLYISRVRRTMGIQSETLMEMHNPLRYNPRCKTTDVLDTKKKHHPLGIFCTIPNLSLLLLFLFPLSLNLMIDFYKNNYSLYFDFSSIMVQLTQPPICLVCLLIGYSKVMDSLLKFNGKGVITRTIREQALV